MQVHFFILEKREGREYLKWQNNLLGSIFLLARVFLEKREIEFLVLTQYNEPSEFLSLFSKEKLGCKDKLSKEVFFDIKYACFLSS